MSMKEAVEGCVAELAGLDGPFVFTELMLQRLWLRGRLNWSGAMLLDGRPVELLRAGRWNRGAGPDFLGASLRLGGRLVEGDVELHLREADWAGHGHSSDPAYGGVVLHAVLFPPREVRATLGWGGAAVPVLPLLPLVPLDLEALALDDAAELLAGDRAEGGCGPLLARTPEECIEILDTHARARLASRTAAAARLLADRGWEEACHAGALGVLGLSRNRPPMLGVAARHPLAEWRSGVASPADLVGEGGACWCRGGRPANFPERRLAQYAAWVAVVPGWPERLAELAASLPEPQSRQPWWRQGAAPGLGELRRIWTQCVCGGTLQGPRFDTLVCEHFLPLMLAAGLGDAVELQEWWLRWLPGDFAGSTRAALRRLFSDRRDLQVNCNAAWQGFHGWSCAQRRAAAL